MLTDSPRLLDHAPRDTAVLGQKGDGQMLGVDLGMAEALRQALRLADHT
jgi:hypothetical protein